MVSLYIDDMIITGDDFDGIASLKTVLSHCFTMKDLGVLYYFLGIEFAPSPKGYFPSQSKYIVDLFERVRLTDNTIIDTPLETSVRYSPFDGVPLTNFSLYRTIVGSLIYLTMTHLDIAHVVHLVSQFVSTHTIVHWDGVLRIFRYLRGTRFQSPLIFFYIIFRLTYLL